MGNEEYIEMIPAFNNNICRGMFIEITNNKVKGRPVKRGIVTSVTPNAVNYVTKDGESAVSIEGVVSRDYLIKTANNLDGFDIQKRVRKLSLSTHHPTGERHLEMEINDEDNKVFGEVCINGLYYNRKYKPIPLEEDM